MLARLLCASVCLVSVLAAPIRFNENSGQADFNKQLKCFSFLTQKLGNFSMILTNTRPITCLLLIKVDSAISYDVYIRSNTEMTSTNSLFRIAIYDYFRTRMNDPPLAEWGLKDLPVAKTFQSAKLWLVDKYGIDSENTISIEVDYVANTGLDRMKCNERKLSTQVFGKYFFTNSTLGSIAKLVCSEGYVLTNGDGIRECRVDNGHLAWSYEPSFCESVCLHPKPVQNALAYLDTRSDSIASRNRVLHSSVKYVCASPYQIVGDPVVFCSPNKFGVPAWNEPLPSCQFHDCSQAITLTAKNGTLKSPKSSSGLLSGGSLNCSWKIEAPKNFVVQIKILFSDLPLEDDVFLKIYEADSILKLTGRTSDTHAFTSTATNVTVTYRGPVNDDSCHQGFKLLYTLIPRSERQRRDAGSFATVDSTVDTTFDASTAASINVNSDSQSPAVQTTLFADTSVSVIVDTLGIEPDTTASDLTVLPTSTDVSTSLQTQSIATFISISVTSEQPSSITPPGGDYQSSSSDQSATVTTFLSTSDLLFQSTEVFDGASPEATTTEAVSAKPEESTAGWKIAVGVILAALGICLIALGGYIYYRKKYPVRMIIGREFAKFSNPTYDRSKQTVDLVRTDADDYFSCHSSGVTPDELNPINVNIQYDNQAFVSDEDHEEADKKFMLRKSYLFSSDEISRPLSEVTLTSNDSETNAKSDCTDSVEDYVERMMSPHQRTPMIKPKRKKLSKNVSSSSSVETSSDDLSVAASEAKLDVSDFNQQRDTPNALSGSVQNLDELQVDVTMESSFMKLSKTILEQPTYEEVCETVRSRSRSLNIEHNPLPESRMRSYSVDPFMSARRPSLKHDDVAEDEQVKQLCQVDLASKIDQILLGQSTTSITSIISESSIIDESLLEGLPEPARERCLSMTSQNSNRHLVTDLDEDVISDASHKSDSSAMEIKPLENNTSEFLSPKERPELMTRNIQDLHVENQSYVHDASAAFHEFAENMKKDNVINEDFKTKESVHSLRELDTESIKSEDYESGALGPLSISDVDEEVLEKSSLRSLSGDSCESSLSFTSGQSESTESSEGEDPNSYSFSNDQNTGEQTEDQAEAVFVKSIEMKHDQSAPPPPSYVSPPVALSPIPETEESFNFPGFTSHDSKVKVIPEIELSEDSSDTSDNGQHQGTRPFPNEMRKLHRMERLSSDEGSDVGEAQLSLDDIAEVLHEIDDKNELLFGALKLPDYEQTFDKQETLNLQGAYVDDDIEV